MSTKLNYAYITQPNPGYLIAGQPSQLVFTVSNPGAPVTLKSLAFTFPYGIAASDLCVSGGVSATALPGSGWTAGTDKNGNFALTPPGGSISVSTKGLTFTLSIQVNSQVGVVDLPGNDTVESFSMEESTDAGDAYWYPPDPLSKFPAGFVFSDLIANPSIVQEGGSIGLKWTGTAGASYTIDWTDAIYSGGQPPIINYKNIVFPAQDSGETLSAGPTPTAVVSVKAAYTTEGQTLHAGPLSVAIGVNLNAPTITSFTATWKGTVLELAWVTENAAPNGVSIPAITSEALLANGSYPFTPSSTQPLPSSITLIATNLAYQTASRTLQTSYLQVAGTPVQVGPGPCSVAVSPDGTRIFVANSGDNTLAVLDAETLKPVSESPGHTGKFPCSVAVSPDGSRVFVANISDNSVTVLDAQTLLPISGSPVLFAAYTGPRSVAVSLTPDGTRVFVACGSSYKIAVIDAVTLKSVESVSLGQESPQSVAVSPDGTRIFVAESYISTGKLAVLDARTLQPISGSPVSVGNAPYSVAVSPDGTRVFVTNSEGNTLTVLDAGTLKAISGSPFPAGPSPLVAAVSPDGARVFVAAGSGNTLTVLDAGTLKPIPGSPFPAGGRPSSVAVSPDNVRVFVADFESNTLTVLAPTFVPANG
jgi:YVTN family beta-propeller protein